MINFAVEAVSPHGYKYSALGGEADEAFLKAFRIWRTDLVEAARRFPKPKIVVDADRRRTQRTHIPTADRTFYRRIYMRRYREARRQHESEMVATAWVIPGGGDES